MTHSHTTNPNATRLGTQTAPHNLQEDNTDTTTLQIATKKAEAASLTQPVDLAALITRLCNSIDPLMHSDDRAILCFCLHHLLIGIDTLSRTTYGLFTEQTSSAAESPPNTMQNLMQRRATWTRLRDIKRILERIEPLCQLLNDASSSMLSLLSSLDTQAISPSPTTPALPEDASTASTIQPLAEQFQDALIPVLDTWQHCLSEQYTFQRCFAHLLSATDATSTTSTAPALPRIDSAFSLLLKSACSLFSDTLPALNTTRQEATATLLFDLMQKVDQILLQIDVIMTPLHTLIKYYALGTETN
jgi:hypothetical protein